MNIIQFTFWLLAAYFVYYAVLLLIDFSRKKHLVNSTNTNELNFTFTENIQPTFVESSTNIDDDSQSDNSDYLMDDTEFADSLPMTKPNEPSPFSMAGVSIKELIDLARNESIQYTQKVAF